MTVKSRIATAALALGFAVAGANSAHALISTSLLSSGAAGDGSFFYTYGVTLGLGSELLGTAQNNRAGTPAGAQFGTVYDFGPAVTAPGGGVIISATGQMQAFAYTFNLTDTPAPGTAPTDNPNLGNVRFTYLNTNTYIYVSGDTPFVPNDPNATSLVLAAESNNLGTFTIQSLTAPSTTPNTSFDGTDYKTVTDSDNAGSAGTRQANLGQVIVPQIATAVPEPASIALMGAGLLGLGFLRRRNAG